MSSKYEPTKDWQTLVEMKPSDHSRLSELALQVGKPLEDVKWYVRIIPPNEYCSRWEPATEVQITMGEPNRGNNKGAGVLYEVPESFIVNMAGALGCKIHEELLEEFPVTVVKETFEEAETDG